MNKISKTFIIPWTNMEVDVYEVFCQENTLGGKKVDTGD